MSTPGKTLTILERVSLLERFADTSSTVLDQDFPQMKSALRNIIEVMNAVIELGGEGFDAKVQAKVMETRQARLDEQIAREKMMLDQLVQAGILDVADSIGEQSVVVGREFSPDGQPVGTGRAQARFDQFTPEAREKLLGQQVGFMLEVATGKFEVLEVYNPGTPKTPDTLPQESDPATAPVAAPASEGAPV